MEREPLRKEGFSVDIMINNSKIRILFCTESSHIQSGYGNYTRSILQRLFDTGKYEIAELSCYRTVSFKDSCPWKIYPNAVEKDDPRFSQYNSSISNSFGQWRFDLVVAHFKPDIVIDFRDVFMTTYQRTSVFRDKFHWILAPTIDSFPVRHEWLDLISNCDTLLTHTEWAKNTIENLYGIKVSGVVRDSIDLNSFKPQNKISSRNTLGLGLDTFIIGSVMRNQKRKLIPNLFKIIGKLNNLMDKKTYLYMHTSYPESIGWDIPDLLLEYNVYNYVLFTYVCNSCKHWTPMKWKGAQTVCPKCSKLKMTLANVSNGISDTDLSKIYSTFDLYIQYSICEGFGIPPLEAAACGIPFITVDHGAMGELADDLGGFKVPVAVTFREQEINADRVYPDDEMCAYMISKFQDATMSEKMKIAEIQTSKILANHSWDKTAKEFEKIIDSVDVQSIDRWEPITTEHFAKIKKNVDPTTNNREFVYNVIDTILEAPSLKTSFFIQQLIMALDNGYVMSNNSIIPYSQSDALKTLEMWFNNKTMLNRFLEDNSVINQNDFLTYNNA